MKKVSLFAVLATSALLAACQGSTGSVTEIDVDADTASSMAAMMDDMSSSSSSSVEAMMDASSSSVDAMEADVDVDADAAL